MQTSSGKHHWFNLPSVTRVHLLLSLGLLVASPAGAAELIYQEGFNNDGVPGGRYTMTGRDAYEVPRIQSALSNFDQKGPIYWEHNFNVSFVGNPNIPGRRVLFTWRTDAAGGAASEDLLKLWDSTVAWLVTNKANATIVVNPNAASINELATRLTDAGHTVVDDDTTAYPDEKDVPGDLFIHGPGANNPSRFAMVPQPVIVINEPDYDDMLVGSIGTLATFDPGPVTIAAPGHPAVGGKTGSFTGFNTGSQPFGLIGSFLPPGATTLATLTRVIPPAVNNLGDVDAMIAGTKSHETATGTVTDIDFADASTGSWFVDNAVPGAYTGNWGLRVQGKITAKTPGTYRLALGSDDGARLQIDLDRNGLSPADTLLEDAGPHGHQFVYTNVPFAAAGDYDFEIRAYNSGGGGSLELSASLVPVPVPDDAMDSGFWEVLSQYGTAALVLQSTAAVTAYRATGTNVTVQTPLIVALNGPNDNPPGAFYDGGAFSGFEGTGFIGGAGLNKWTYPDGAAYRAVRLKPVNVAGKTNLHLTIALAATQVDFEDSDLLDIVVYPNGASSSPTTLAHFRGVQNAIQPWLADQQENYVRRLTKQFTDFTYEIPPGATDLVVEIRGATTWWTEILAFDNIRISSGEITTLPSPTISIARDGADTVITFANGTLQRAASLDGPGSIQWTNVVTTGGTFRITPAQQTAREYFRVQQ